jgi:thymidine phosphorylase
LALCDEALRSGKAMQKFQQIIEVSSKL